MTIRSFLSHHRRTVRSLKTGLLSIAVLFIVIIGFGRSPALAVTPRHYTDLQFPPAPEVKLPEYTRYQLPNGLMAYLVEDHELPLVSGTALIRTCNS